MTQTLKGYPKPNIKDYKLAADYMKDLCDWEKDNAPIMSNELKCTPGNWEISTSMSRIEGEWDIIGNGDIIATVTETEDANLIAASPDLYNALKKIHSECHKLLNRGTNEKLSVINRLTIIGAIGETCEAGMKKANPYYKP